MCEHNSIRLSTLLSLRYNRVKMPSSDGYFSGMSPVLHLVRI